MKKIILSALSMMVALTMSAITYQDQVSITVDDGTYMNTIVVGEADELPAGINNGYASEIQNIDEMPLAIYALYKGVKYNPFVMKSYENQPLVIKTTEATTYTLYFDDVTGTVNLYDKKLGAAVPVTESGDYEFTITNEEKNSLLNDRFYLNYNAAAFAYSLTTNAYGWASFSIEAEDVVATVPTGLKIYKGALQGVETLNLTEVNYVPANTGVIVYGTPNTTYYFAAGTGTSDFSDNVLKPTSAYTVGDQNVFVLKGNALLQYTGNTALAANKAYLQLPGATTAPQRIRMVINQEQAIENVEAVEAPVKFVENGQIFIRRGNEVYNLQGQMVK